MTPTRPHVQRLSDGSIDFDFYRGLAEAARRQAVRGCVERLGTWLRGRRGPSPVLVAAAIAVVLALPRK